ncbi:MAG: hypothetical protein J0J01_05530 [Reyranella sp.]|uniref:hypothetical protein n=1 Tax=Reyranella sp. TaxID=1929291 RepID=UPI001ACD29D7|nr:hypothetical protein [Reyranella sp.]MBN9086348.1 hypothetical protein [Reyranella sp.]
MRIEPWLRRLLYATLATLFATGAVWWWLDEGAAARPTLLALHGLAAMLSLLALGAVAVLHARASWSRRRNRSSGVIVACSLAVLVTTAFALYYAGQETLRDLASLVHLVAGLALPLILLVHISLGIRSRRALDDDDW